VSQSSESSGLTDGLSRAEILRLLRALSLPFAACLVFFLVTPTGVQPLKRSRAEIRREVLAVIEGQFSAFQDGDYARARAFAAPGIQQQFDVAAFERMVKDGYPVIAYWRTVHFGDVEDNGREAVALVSVRGRRGQTRFFRYLLVREGGQWRINGVVEVQVSPAAQGQIV
jgi:hypothetical protein